MGLPIRYNLRNLFRRKLRTFLTILGIGLVVSIAVVMLAYSRGLLLSLRNNGDPVNAMVFSRRATDREFSSVKPSQFDLLSGLLMDDVDYYPPEGEEGEDNYSVDLVAPFVSHTFLIRIPGRKGESEAARRGVVVGIDIERAYYLHEPFRLKTGRLLNDNDERGVLVGALAYARLDLDPEDLQPGATLSFGGAEWPVVGVFEAPGTSLESEIWVLNSELMTVLNRTSYNYIIVKALDEAGMRNIVDFVNRSEQVELRAVSEVEYYRGFAESFHTFAMIGGVMALIITLGGIMVGMNTMFTAVTGRIREIGVLQVLGFSKRSILMSVVLESVLIAIVGGALGCALGRLVNGLPMRATMGVFLFRVDTLVLVIGMSLSFLIGLVGALLPAIRAVRIPKVEAMRYM